MPKVSFILPAYKQRYLREAIASVLSQTFMDFELVVVDDASPENLKEVVDGFQDSRLSYHRNEQNIGGKDLVAAWNHAMEYATCEWCVLASDDDCYAPAYLETLLALAEKYPKADLLHCRIACMDENGAVTSVGEYRAEWESCWEMLYYRGVRRSLQMAPEFMFRRSALEKIGGFVNFPQAIFTDDATWYALAKDKGVVCAHQCLLKWRMSGINICTCRDNVVRKAKATLQFQEWLHCFMEIVPVKSAEDETYKRLVSKDIDSSIWQNLESFLKSLAFPQWLKTMKSLEIKDASLKKYLWHNRFKRLCTLHW